MRKKGRPVNEKKKGTGRSELKNTRENKKTTLTQIVPSQTRTKYALRARVSTRHTNNRIVPSIRGLFYLFQRR